ncbi:MAG: hypothetical protein ABI091_19885 [Ferruginibacter sp.]
MISTSAHKEMYMNAYPALLVAGTLFGIVALMHVLRLFYRTEIIIGGKVIPMWLSIIGFILPLGLSIWMFMASAG